jgi:hypothetical protein
VRSGTFKSLPPGWHEYDEAVQRIGPCHVVANTLASSWHADRADVHGWASSMPRDAIAITVSLIGPPLPEDKLDARYPPITKVPVRLPATTVSTLEGFPQMPEYRGFRRAADYLLEVRAVINNPEPGRRLLREARGVVSRLQLPDWPKLC